MKKMHDDRLAPAVLAGLAERAKAATPGPWRWSGGMDSRAIVLADDEGFKVRIDGHPDAEFIAAADPQTVGALVAEVEALRAVVARVEALCAEAEREGFEDVAVSSLRGRLTPAETTGADR